MDYSNDFWIENKEKIKQVIDKISSKFVVLSPYVKINASYNGWFDEEWGRDTFISLEGLLLVRNKYEYAKSIFLRWIKYEKKGLMPTLPERNYYGDADTSLWFIYALSRYYYYTKDLHLISKTRHTVENILYNYINGTSYEDKGIIKQIYMDDDFLIITPERATWMDADALGKLDPITPRQGKTVEINALYYEGLLFAKYLEDVGYKFDIDLDYYIKGMKKNFQRKFYDVRLGYLRDVIDGDKDGDALRPNMLFALRSNNLVDYDIIKSSIEKINKELLTPYGLRSLSPKHPRYKGEHRNQDPIEIKDLAYHNGSVWPWIMGCYIDVIYKIMIYEGSRYEDIKNKLRDIMFPLTKYLIDYGTIPEIFSGDSFTPSGTTYQAWSIGEIWRVIINYGLLED